jgi:4-carboxymuconolactone decarboxylase
MKAGPSAGPPQAGPHPLGGSDAVPGGRGAPKHDGPDRLPPIPPAQWTAAQRAEAEAMIAGPRGAVLPPFVPLMRSPELMGHVQRLGAHLRYRSALGVRLTELAILVTSKHYEQPVEWAIHAPIAEREGIAAATVTAIDRGERPSAMADDEALVHDFCVELLQGRGRVGDGIWAHAVACFGEPAAVDLVATCGYYGLLALVMNAARTPA